MISSSPLAATAGLSLLAVLAGCNSSDGPDVTAPAAASFVQDRQNDPSGQTIAVTFSEDVTAATAEVAASYTISGGVTVNSATLRPSGNVVELALDAPAIPGDNTIAIAAGIEDTVGNASAEVTATALTSTDTAAPEASLIEGVTVSGPENDMIMVVFNDDVIQSEVETIGNWTVEAPEGEPFDITGATVSYNEMTRTATVTLGGGSADQNLQTFDDIHATFSGIRDLGGNTIDATIIGTTAVNGMVGGDTTPPTLTAAAPGSGNDLTLTFSEAVTQLETADLRTAMNANGTDIVLRDDNDPGEAAMGTVALSGTVVDGDSITISDGSTTLTFEFDYGATGSFALSGQPNDADSVVINDGATAVTFEFDVANDGVAGGNTLVLANVDTATTVASLLMAINGAAFNVIASAGGTTDELDLRNVNTGTGGNAVNTPNDTAGVQSLSNMTGGGVAGANVTVAVDITDIAATVTFLRTAIDNASFNIATSNGGTANDFVVENTSVGAAGDAPITDSEQGTAIAVTPLTGGQDAGTETLVPSVSTTATLNELQAVATFPSAPEADDTVRIFGVTDLAGNQMLPLSAAAVVPVDVGAPNFLTSPTLTVTSGEFNDEIVMLFSRDINSASALDLANYEVFDTAVLDIEGATVALTDTDEVTLRFGKGSGLNLMADDSYSVTASNMVSIQGVAGALTSSASLTPSGDTAAPTIGATDARLDPNDSTAAIFTFSEALSETGGIDIANYTLAGNATVSASFLTARVVRVVFSSNLAESDSVEIAAAAVTDLGGNGAVGIATLALAAADASVPTLDTVTSVSGSADGRDMVTLIFSEPIPTSQITTAANFTITSGGAAVDLTGADFTESSINDSVVIRLAEGFSLQTGDSIIVAPANLTDTSGNAIVATAVTETVTGDTTNPTVGGIFVNVLVESGGTMVDVQFSERMNTSTTLDTANWNGSNGQTATSVTQLTASRYRVTFSAAIGVDDTVAITTPTDRAGNLAGTITVNPAE